MRRDGVRVHRAMRPDGPHMRGHQRRRPASQATAFRQEAQATARATWNGAVIAESDATVEVEGNQYFPPDAVDRGYLREAASHTVCGWKGTASYYDVVVDGAVNAEASLLLPGTQRRRGERRRLRRVLARGDVEA
jgi:uncharacterized protein (DUF427 family)